MANGACIGLERKLRNQGCRTQLLKQWKRVVDEVSYDIQPGKHHEEEEKMGHLAAPRTWSQRSPELFPTTLRPSQRARPLWDYNADGSEPHNPPLSSSKDTVVVDEPNAYRQVLFPSRRVEQLDSVAPARVPLSTPFASLAYALLFPQSYAPRHPAEKLIWRNPPLAVLTSMVRAPRSLVISESSMPFSASFADGILKETESTFDEYSRPRRTVRTAQRGYRLGATNPMTKSLRKGATQNVALGQPRGSCCGRRHGPAPSTCMEDRPSPSSTLSIRQMDRTDGDTF
ncbi:uncharacterized protein C8Q71DRAFT_721460 [Rhodofomes roseus]|uniref:Uncharacterized protein n=1 Tax=Rhodofomes roseus TaxID=34475 RepID=A0ABQ8KQY3_9APHY|nr:uncharacterized protein C8Q71DRAFT_721460 [Rhodofomes roseus]KAH9841042.1 hypothetical protein C8Q71DRAFT_721460 [Rhodofomes roseus]